VYKLIQKVLESYAQGEYFLWIQSVLTV